VRPSGEITGLVPATAMGAPGFPVAVLTGINDLPAMYSVRPSGVIAIPSPGEPAA